MYIFCFILLQSPTTHQSSRFKCLLCSVLNPSPVWWIIFITLQKPALFARPKIAQLRQADVPAPDSIGTWTVAVTKKCSRYSTTHRHTLTRERCGTRGGWSHRFSFQQFSASWRWTELRDSNVCLKSMFVQIKLRGFNFQDKSNLFVRMSAASLFLYRTTRNALKQVDFVVDTPLQTCAGPSSYVNGAT